MAFASDSGRVGFVDLNTWKVSYDVKQVHDAFCTSLLFSQQNPNAIYSAGFDMKVFSHVKGKERDWESDCIFNAREEQTGNINPPFIHQISMSNDGEVVCAAVGDGSVTIIPILEGDDIVQYADAHNGAVQNV